MTVFQLIRSDYRRYRKYGSSFGVILFFTQGFWASCQYRIAHYCFRKLRWQPFRAIVLGFMLCWQKAIEMATGISLPASCQIGHSFYVGHFGGIIVNAQAVIGSHCNIAQGVTIGISGQGDKRGVPLIGNSVFLGANAVVAGKISIGDHALIGANSLVTSNVMAGTTVLGVPAVVISHHGSNGYL